MTVVSRWTHLGHDRPLCAQHGARIPQKPVDLGRILPVSGGRPLCPTRLRRVRKGESDVLLEQHRLDVVARKLAQ